MTTIQCRREVRGPEGSRRRSNRFQPILGPVASLKLLVLMLAVRRLISDLLGGSSLVEQVAAADRARFGIETSASSPAIEAALEDDDDEDDENELNAAASSEYPDDEADNDEAYEDGDGE